MVSSPEYGRDDGAWFVGGRTTSLDHYRQLSVDLRELDVAIQSIYRPSADQNPFA